MKSSLTTKLVRACFYSAVVSTLALALAPPSYSPVLVSDKVEHFAGFLVLMLLGTWAFGKRRTHSVAFVLVGFGAAIEILQMLPFIGRDGEVLDWVADTFGVLSALAITAALSALVFERPKF